MAGPMDRSPPNDSDASGHAWKRFRRILAAWSWFTLATVLAVLVWQLAVDGFQSIHLLIAMALGVGLTMLLGGALMGLVFASSSAGHDEAVRDYSPEDSDPAG
jgi:hypothetical protein